MTTRPCRCEGRHGTGFSAHLPEDLVQRGWYYYDFLLITGDAYVDHPSFGTAIISRVLEAEGYRVAILPQPDWRDPEAFTALGRPRYGVFVNGGNIDSMVAHYTVAKKRRHDDAYSPGNRAGLRPDRAVIVYANKVREAFGDIPLIIGGLEASLRRFAHYDYWEDKVRRSVLFDSQADLLVYGMGETATREIAARLASGTPIGEITDVKGTAFMARDPSACAYPKVECPSFEEVSTDKRAYAQANQIQYEEHDPIRGRAILQRHGDRLLVVNPPAMPLTTAELDLVAELPYVREPHPMYDQMGGVPAIEEVRFSVAHNRGCFGACNFCSLAFHQGRIISSRSHESVLREVEALTKHPGFKGYIHDVGGPTANFRRPACKKQMKAGLCRGRACLAPEPCPNLDADHTDYLMLLRKIRAVPGVKKVFIRSGIRFDYMMQDQERGVLRRAGEVPRLRPAEGGPGALRGRRAGLHGQAPHRGVREVPAEVRAAQPEVRQGAVPGALPHVLPPRLHPGRRGAPGRVAQPAPAASRSRCRTSTPPRAPCPPACTTPASTPAPCSRCTSPRIPTRRPCSGP